MIRSFADRDTERVWQRKHVSKMHAELQRHGLRKLTILDAAVVLQDLRVPPGNHLEPLQGDRKGQHSIKINSQWRVCFRWTDAGPEDVEIVDYH